MPRNRNKLHNLNNTVNGRKSSGKNVKQFSAQFKNISKMQSDLPVNKSGRKLCVSLHGHMYWIRLMMHCKLARNVFRQHKKRPYVSLMSSASRRKKLYAAGKRKNSASLNKQSVNVPYSARVLKPKPNDALTRKRFSSTCLRPADI